VTLTWEKFQGLSTLLLDKSSTSLYYLRYIGLELRIFVAGAESSILWRYRSEYYSNLKFGAKFCLCERLNMNRPWGVGRLRAEPQNYSRVPQVFDHGLCESATKLHAALKTHLSPLSF
jgi:hypothetical protein